MLSVIGLIVYKYYLHQWIASDASCLLQFFSGILLRLKVVEEFYAAGAKTSKPRSLTRAWE